MCPVIIEVSSGLISTQKSEIMVRKKSASTHGLPPEMIGPPIVTLPSLQYIGYADRTSIRSESYGDTAQFARTPPAQIP